MTFEFTTISAAYMFAHSDAGEAYIDEHHDRFVQAPWPHEVVFIGLYTTPQAAALAALREISVHDLDVYYDIVMPLEAHDFDEVNAWSVAEYEFEYEERANERRYAAGHGQPEHMTHTDRGGFEDWLRGDDRWFDEEWVERRRGA